MHCPLEPRRLGRTTLLAVLCVASSLSPSSWGASAGADQAAHRIVEKADRIRFPAEGFQVDVRITNMAPDRGQEVREYRILSKGNDRTLVLTTAPASDRGQILLMRDQDLWIFMPNVSRPIRLPLSQKLTGQVANGDLARANFTGDYSPKLLEVEKIDGEEYYVLELTAARRGVTYHRIRYWVHKRSHRPYRAQFYTVSKRLLKTVHYREFKEMGGRLRPTRLIMDDNLREGERSVMDYANMKTRALPDKVFTKQYLKKLKH